MRNLTKLSVAGLLLVGSAGVAKADTIVNLINGTSDTGNFVNGALFEWTPEQPTGTGVIQPFLRIQQNGSEHGFNTNADGQLDNKNDGWTRAIQISNIPTTDLGLGGQLYYVFLLDINEDSGGSHELLSLNELKVYVESSASTATLTAAGLAGLTPDYNLDAVGSDNRIDLDYSRNSGSGSGDMFAYIPVVAGAASTDYLVLYSKFETPYGTSDGFEEWATFGTPSTPLPGPTPAPLPGTASAGVALLSAFSLRRRHR
jgi:hypothetical protein